MRIDELVDDAVLKYVTKKTHFEVDGKEYRKLVAELHQAVNNAVIKAIEDWRRKKE